MAQPPAAQNLKFSLWTSSVSEDFWHHLADTKLVSLHLDDKPLEIRGFFTPAPHQHYLQLRQDSFPAKATESNRSFDHVNGNINECYAPGTLYNSNTIEEFLAIDKRDLMKKEATKIWDDICSGRALQDCTLLNRFFVISFADLKKWRFHYWFAFPALAFQPPATCVNLKPASQFFKEDETEALLLACKSWRDAPQSRWYPFFLLHINGSVFHARPLSEWSDCNSVGKVILAFYDPSQDPNFPGWPLRNFLALAAVQWHCQSIHIFCYREKKGQADLDHCLAGDIIIPDLKDQNEAPDAVGWEYNLQQKGRPKLAPKMVDLASFMDPTRLAQDAASLNLKLMRWRLLPSLNMDLLSKTKCLLLGAGTLGCQVARGLMAWGINHVTLVDCGRVAMSNPVRQSLYSFEDCLNGGRQKAEAAAENLRRILPGVNADGIELTIPMPGHSVTESEVKDVMKSCDRLQELVNNHDIIFLLTDTRESRWLPTLLCTNANKITINAALGFGTYLVMRHGTGPGTLDMDSEKRRLGCYFCNDVVAPEDSTVNRTLDQQCTVTRPGVAPIAAALAVELAVNLLHHPLRINAPADMADSTVERPLGIIPHQIRGFVANFSQMVIVGTAFNKCTACSHEVIAEYRRSGFNFLLQVFNHPSYLEDITGLTNLHNATKEISIEWEDVEDEEDA